MIAGARTSKRILLIDDDFLLREMVTLTLAGEGYMVATASNGEDALHRLRTYELPNLILLDLTLPGMDGYHFSKYQRQDLQLASIPVLLISAVGDIEQQAASLGACGYLQKPLDTAQLLDAVRRCCC
jgi:CheY-like chemotaxis protein